VTKYKKLHNIDYYQFHTKFIGLDTDEPIVQVTMLQHFSPGAKRGLDSNPDLWIKSQVVYHFATAPGPLMLQNVFSPLISGACTIKLFTAVIYGLS